MPNQLNYSKYRRPFIDKFKLKHTFDSYKLWLVQYEDALFHTFATFYPINDEAENDEIGVYLFSEFCLHAYNTRYIPKLHSSTPIYGTFSENGIRVHRIRDFCLTLGYPFFYHTYHQRNVSSLYLNWLYT